MGVRYRYRSVDDIMSEIKELVENYQVDHLVFEDDTLTLKRDRIESLCEALAAMPNHPSWYCLSRVDSIDLPLAKKMKAAGCKMINFGIESGSPEILEKIGKKINLAKAQEAVRACTQAGLRTQCIFIVGFPFDTDKTLAMTYAAAQRINPTIAIFFPLTPYPGTKIFNEFLDPAIIPKNVEDWERFIMTNNKSGISLNKQFTAEAIIQKAAHWNRSYYLQPRHWLQLMRTVNSFPDIYRLAKGGWYLLSTYVRRQV